MSFGSVASGRLPLLRLRETIGTALQPRRRPCQQQLLELKPLRLARVAIIIFHRPPALAVADGSCEQL